MSADTFVTFAYGSNMPVARLHKRCPSARAIGIAQLPGHELRWHKRSIDSSGKCDIVAVDTPHASVFGVLYEIAAHQKTALDKAEGLGAGYEEIEIEVLCDGNPVKATAYQATNTDSTLRPYTWYRALVISGAKEYGLSASYIAGLESSPADEDTDLARHDSNMALIERMQT